MVTGSGGFVSSLQRALYSAQEVVKAAERKNVGLVEACGPLVPLFVNLIVASAWFYYSVRIARRHAPAA